MPTATIPRLKLETESLVRKAETGGCYCFKSRLPMTEVCMNEQNTLLLTRNNGYLFVAHDDLPVLISELQDVQEDLPRIRKLFQER